MSLGCTAVCLVLSLLQPCACAFSDHHGGLKRYIVRKEATKVPPLDVARTDGSNSSGNVQMAVGWQRSWNGHVSAWPWSQQSDGVQGAMRSTRRAYDCDMPGNMHVLQGDAVAFLRTSLTDRKPFSFVRYGDGEWLCVQGKHFENTDKLPAYKEMCDKLAAYTKDTSSRAGVTMLFSHHICAFTTDIGQYASDLGTWYAFFGFFEALESQKGASLAELMTLVSRRGPVVVVGPAFLGRLHKAFSHVSAIRVPNPKTCGDRGDAWMGRAKIVEAIRAQSATYPDSGVQFVVAGGMAAKLIVMDMVAELGHKDSFLDIGSTFDGFAGYATRDYNQNLKRKLAGGPLQDWFNETDAEKVGC
eukprot:TRINITY_DN58896_c0_g1_i1.p1 TRINITY_DN58896_c0_g1~~TRINITY_DN58896_c0_g1_i1.p1  ORF type:complete len:358 (-),score=32.07 TRINITY_DN58896_c0_g1_i1:189-1262(-)